MSTEPSPAIGRDIGPYRVEAVLGRGGMGVVYRARDPRLERQVALKVLPSGYSADETFRARFLRESRMAASIDHPGVIPIYEAGEAGGELYIAMRHVEGTDLAELLRREGPLQPERAVALVTQLAAALDAAHARGLVHRDVKPSNALVDHEHVYLADFGLSKAVSGASALSATGSVVGTALYMAPETIRTGEADARSDLYALGCVLFECLTGQAPYPGPGEAAVIYGHLEEPPPTRHPELPRAFAPVIARALDKDPERRFQSGAELAAAAQDAVATWAPRQPRRRPALMAAAAVILLIAAAAAATRLGGDGGELGTLRANAVAVVDPGDRSLIAQVPLDGAPGAIAASAGAVWVADADRDVVSRLDTETHTVRQTIEVGREPAAIAVTRDAVWVANAQSGTVTVISPATNEVVDTIRVGRTAEDVCAGAGGVWVTSPSEFAVIKIDPESGRRTARVRLDRSPSRLACGRSTVWAAEATGTLTEIGSGGAILTTAQAGRGPGALALGAGALWVANALDGTVSRLDPGTGAVTATVPVGAQDRPGALAFARGSLWVSSEDSGTIARIDPDRREVVEKLRVGNRPQGLVAVDGALWVSVADDGARHRGGTLRLVEQFEVSPFDLDPATTYSPAGWQLTSLMYDGLTTVRREGGVAGATVVANLARTIPAPAAAGRVYTFRVRPGIRYANGVPVRASHIRFGLERSVGTGPPASGIYASIEGVQQCRPQRCDLSRGVVADDAAGTVTFRLARADADLPYKLALPFAVALPPSVGRQAPRPRRLAGTGPYRLAAYDPRRSLRLERNPRFESWSAAARPDGYADVVEARFGVPTARAVRDVLSGRADVVADVNDLDPREFADLQRRAPGRVRAVLTSGTAYFFLNTSVAPFDRLQVRRAVARALDRPRAYRAGGAPALAEPTCRMLPPFFPASSASCPHRDDAPRAQRIADARAAVRRSGTRGMRVEVLAPDRLPAELPAVLTSTLRRIGYRASSRVLPADEFFTRAADNRERVQAGLTGWQADFPSPAGFLDQFSCDARSLRSQLNVNYPQFCDRVADRLMAQAARAQAAEPSAADALWARAEQRILEQAPVLPVVHRLAVYVVSERLGNFRYSPMYDALLDRAWVR